eukprot:SAG31_NODE_19091_length_612_cov_1.120858_2_plen_85_part_01
MRPVLIPIALHELEAATRQFCLDRPQANPPHYSTHVWTFTPADGAPGETQASERAAGEQCRVLPGCSWRSAVAGRTPHLAGQSAQ